MAEGREEREWARTSALLALVANVNRDTKKRPKPYTPDEFNPYSKKNRNRRKGSDAVKLTKEQSVQAVADVFRGMAAGAGRREAPRAE